MIVAHLIYDIRSLRACSLTCYSWYIAAVPPLHHTLFVYIDSLDLKFRWPKPLRYMHTLGLLPLVKRFRIHRGCFSDRAVGFSPGLFNYCILRQLLVLTNVRELGIDYLNIPKFMPRIQQYFGHFLPTVRDLTLRAPKGSRRQIIYFIGLFQHLEDLQLLYDSVDTQDEPVDDLTLIPPFAPPLRGRLTIKNSTRVGLLKDMIDLFGGIRFRQLDLFNVVGMRLLLDSCTKTLKILRLHPSDPRGEGVSLECKRFMADDPTAGSSLQDFDLSRNGSLQELRVTARSVDDSSETASRLLKYALSTVQSPVLFKVVVLYRDYDFRGVRPKQDPTWPPLREMSQVETTEEASRHHRRFKLFRKVRKVREFRLVLCADVWEPIREYSVQMLKEAVTAEKAKKGFDNFFSKPLVTYNHHRSRL